MNPDVLKQIEEMDAEIIRARTQSQALSGAPVSPTDEAAVQAAIPPKAPAAVEEQEQPAPALDSQPAPSAPVPSFKPPPGTPNVLGDAKPHDVLQVNNRDSKHHGTLFTVGEIRGPQVHGYILKDGGGKDFITVKISEVHRIGESKVRSAVPCSRQWKEQNQQ